MISRWIMLGIAALGLAAPVSAQQSRVPAELAVKVSTGIDADAARLDRTFKDLHQHPELGSIETRTAGIVAKELKSLGFELQTGICSNCWQGTPRTDLRRRRAVGPRRTADHALSDAA